MINDQKAKIKINSDNLAYVFESIDEINNIN